MLNKTVKKLAGLRKPCAGLLIFFITLMLSVAAQAQPSDPGQGDCGTSPDDPCPIDTWVLALVVLALYFGYRQIQKQKSFATQLAA